MVHNDRLIRIIALNKALKKMDQIQLLSLMTILIVIVILLAFMWLIETSGRLRLDKIRFDD
jgi:hypothetical protein